MDRYIVASNRKRHSIVRLTCLTTKYLHIYLGALLATEHLHDARVLHLYPGNHSVIDLYDTVACENADTLRRTAGNGLNDIKCILIHIERDTDTAELALQRLIQFASLFGSAISGVRVKLIEHTANGIFDQLVFVDRIDVVVGHKLLCRTQFLTRRKFTELSRHHGRHHSRQEYYKCFLHFLLFLCIYITLDAVLDHKFNPYLSLSERQIRRQHSHCAATHAPLNLRCRRARGV